MAAGYQDGKGSWISVSKGKLSFQSRCYRYLKVYNRSRPKTYIHSLTKLFPFHWCTAFVISSNTIPTNGSPVGNVSNTPISAKRCHETIFPSPLAFVFQHQIHQYLCCRLLSLLTALSHHIHHCPQLHLDLTTPFMRILPKMHLALIGHPIIPQEPLPLRLLSQILGFIRIPTITRELFKKTVGPRLSPSGKTLPADMFPRTTIIPWISHPKQNIPLVTMSTFRRWMSKDLPWCKNILPGPISSPIRCKIPSMGMLFFPHREISWANLVLCPLGRNIANGVSACSAGTNRNYLLSTKFLFLPVRPHRSNARNRRAQTANRCGTFPLFASPRCALMAT